MAMMGNKEVKVVNNQVVHTNQTYFFKCCYTKDLCQINRMWLKHLDQTVGRDAPLFVKEEEYNKWLLMDFDVREWDRAKSTTKDEDDDSHLLSKYRKAAKAVERDERDTRMGIQTPHDKIKALQFS